MESIFRNRASALCCHNGKVLMVEMEDPATTKRYLFPPGGLIETGESPSEAAIRETLEETGYQVREIGSEPVVVQYPFIWNNVFYDCRTHLVKTELVDPRQAPGAVNDRSYNLGAKWIEIKSVPTVLDFCTPLAESIAAILSK